MKLLLVGSFQVSFIFYFLYMVSLQYIGQSHTLIFLPGEKVKTKVSEGEIIDIEIDEKEIKRYQLAGFQIVDGKSPKAPAEPKA